MLLNINKGNKFLITTRNPKIAAIAAAKDKTVFLKPLKPDECLPLIEEYAKSDAPSPAAITEEIIKECEGVPLAAITLGLKLSEGTIRGGDIWSTEDVEEQGSIMNSLKFSYDYLPPRLKDCFAYHVVCNDLHKEILTQMWTAQGFTEEPDDGNTAFEKLQNASFFHDVEEHIFPGTLFQVLKLFRSLILVSKEYKHANATISEIAGVFTRHVSLSSSPREPRVQKPRLLDKLRTAVGPLSKFRGLRVLVLCGVEFETSAISLGDLKHLRYLDLSKNGSLEELPESLGQLLFLKTLRVDQCNNLKELRPNEINKLTNLRYLYASSLQASLEFEGLSSLQTLHLKNFQNLEKLPEMSYFTKLESLEILDCPRLCCREVDLKDLTSLKRLAIINLSKLQTIHVGPVSSGLKLNSIHLSNCDNLTNLTEGFRTLTSLERLTIEDCPGLESSLSTVDGQNILPDNLKSLRMKRSAELTEIYRRGEGRDDVSWITEVYLNGVLFNPVPNVEPSPSSSSYWWQIFRWLMRWVITRLNFYFDWSQIFSCLLRIIPCLNSYFALIVVRKEGSNGRGTNGNGEGSSTHPHQSDGVLINPVPNVEPSSAPSSSSAETGVLTEGSNGGTTEPEREEISATTIEPSNADPPNGDGEGSSTRPHQSDRNLIKKFFRNGVSNIMRKTKRRRR